MKIGVQICVHDDYQFLQPVVEALLPNVDNIIIMLNNKPWRGENKGNEDCKELSYTLTAFHKVKVIEGEWDTEQEQRNDALKECEANGIDYCMIIDSDEIVSDNGVQNLKEIIKIYPNVNLFLCVMDTFWKLAPFCIIQPREGLNPPICVKVGKFIFTDKRHGTGVDKSGRPVSAEAALLPENAFLLYHLSYARTDEFVKKKLSNFMHSHEIINNWYENVWLKWKEGDVNIHPVAPSQYKRAVPVDASFLPQAVQDIIEFEKELNRWKPDGT